jgi:O-acetyl-ADP-ribose deacetylase (regulator of RNase III)
MSKIDIIQKITIKQGDITLENSDAIVNAANTSLLGGGGVDGAIHKAAGPELIKECKAFGGCNSGEARITKGYNLKAGYIIHTPGPVYKDGKRGETQILGKIY